MSADLAAEVTKLATERAQIEAELQSLADEREVHRAAETEARNQGVANDAKRMALRKRRDSISKTLESHAVKQQIVTNLQASAEAKNQAEASAASLKAQQDEAAKITADMKAQQAELAALLEKAKAGEAAT